MVLDRIIRLFLGGIGLWVAMIAVNFPGMHRIRSESFGIAHSLKNAKTASFIE